MNGIDRLSVGYATAAAEEISGDTAISCGLPDGSLALILCDGMGKGAAAAAESGTVARRLKRNLKSGMSVAQAIKEVNRHMIESAQRASEKEGRSCATAESFATVDLLIIDRSCGKARFYKMGAASSFVLRDGSVRKLEQAALPVGIIANIRLTHKTAMLRPGDIVIMVSDGITDADREDLSYNWLMELLSGEEGLAELGAKKIADFILKNAQDRCDPSKRDDQTAAVVKIPS